MRNLKPSVLAKTALTILLLTHTTIALPFVPDPMVPSIRPPVKSLSLGQSLHTRLLPAALLHRRKRLCCAERCCIYGCCVKKNATAHHTNLIETSPPKPSSSGMETLLTVMNPWFSSFNKNFYNRHLDEEDGKKKGAAATNITRTTTTTTTTNSCGAAAAVDDHDEGDGGSIKKEIIARRTYEEEEEQNNNNNHDTTIAIPIIRIFPNGSFSTFTPEQTNEFYILRKAQGEGPDPRDPPVEHPAPLGIDQTPKPSKEPSLYDQYRICNSSGEWCSLPLKEGSTLLAGIGIGSCTYYEEDGLWGKTITYHAC